MGSWENLRGFKFSAASCDDFSKQKILWERVHVFYKFVIKGTKKWKWENKKNPCMIEEIVRGNEGESEQGHKRKWKNAEVN